MRNKLLIEITASALMLNGCGHFTDMSPSKAKSVTTMSLCANYGYVLTDKSKKTNIKKELLRRNAFTQREWNLINSKSVAVGMSSEALVCSIGYPNYINRASYGNQAVYVDNGYRRFVYTENGRVTAWN